MALLCTRCNTTIAVQDIDRSRGVYYCNQCHEYFQVPENTNIPEYAEDIPVLPKPSGSLIFIRQENDGILVVIPPKEWPESIYFHMLLTLIAFAASAFPFLIKEPFSVFMLIPFALFSVSLVWLLFSMYGRILLLFTGEKITVTWKLFQYSYSKKRETLNLTTITEAEMHRWKKNNDMAPTYGIGLTFNNKPEIRFGYRLDEDERLWLIQELRRIKAFIGKNRS